jgi:NADPH2:quinone reductase
MNAVVITRPGGPHVLELQEVPTPAPGRNEILVRVKATAINRADLLQRRGAYPAPPGVSENIPGLEYSGVVEELGSGAKRWQAGDRVMGLTGGGAYAEFVVVHESEALRLPELLSFEQAAAVPEAFITADDALFTLMKLQRGETVLIHAAASGVGTAAVQLARATGATVIATSRTAAKLSQIMELGVSIGIDASRHEFVAEVARCTHERGVHGVLDLVGGDYFARSLQTLAQNGRLVLVGLTGGPQAQVNLSTILRKRLRIEGTVMRVRSLTEKIVTTAAFAGRSLPLLANGSVKPIIDRVLPMTEVQTGHSILEGNENVGKVVLAW